MTATATGPAAEALAALDAGECSDRCLLSEDTGRCRCHCQGLHHGALRRALQGEERPHASAPR